MASFIFPEDLGTDQNGHYVSFNAYKTTGTSRVISNALSGGSGLASEIGYYTGLSNTFGYKNYQPPQNTQASQGTVFMYVPGGGQTGLQWDQEHTYTDVKLARLATNAIGVTDALETGAQLAGYAINPRIEVLYQTTKLRTFEFMFMMAPQSENESRQMEAIINFFREKAAPTLTTNTLAFEAPHEWIIQFGRKSSGGGWTVNPHLPAIGRSICNRVNVSYPAPGAEYSTFTNGYPVSALLQMRFAEMSIIDSTKIAGGY
ncbi:hypothetical protein EB001_07215 [bacterium]|nr:hypothetical protein [bacterium]